MSSALNVATLPISALSVGAGSSAAYQQVILGTTVLILAANVVGVIFEFLGQSGWALCAIRHMSRTYVGAFVRGRMFQHVCLFCNINLQRWRASRSIKGRVDLSRNRFNRFNVYNKSTRFNPSSRLHMFPFDLRGQRGARAMKEA